MKMHRLATALLFSLFGLASGAQAIEKIPGVAASINPPEGFAQSKQFSGYFNEKSGASIMATEMSSPLEEVQHGFIPDLLTVKGVRVLGSEQAERQGKKLWLYKIAQSDGSVDYHKWILLQGDGKGSLMMVGTYQAANESTEGAKIKDALLSLEVQDEARNKVSLDGLSYTVKETENLKITKRMNSALAMTRPGDPFPSESAEPLLVIAPSFNNVEIGDLASFAEKHLKSTSSLIEAEVVKDSVKSLKIGGLDAVELQANAEDARNHKPVKVYQAIIVSSDGYYVIKGIVKSELSEQFLPEFRQIAHGLTVNK
ncbi:hypothetical protein SOASR030_27390 [Leminorella grimontii]|uniref:DUF1795 domain-containing protein n=2 Tax=Leminorella grimontii TaxID=82981 RepID=A0AAV5N8F2_9GAMM|nr:hypothetical protein [Leminorella grimontii]KFC94530.1 hypothetical protein GLGR_2647 [Leminorella grimontii ATCC 33999 = DSM 5078]GKX56627.1 hypothetical protein SOASR030_27390 [Leminorella grimontii]